MNSSPDNLSQVLAECENLLSDTIIKLTEEDFEEVAQRLGVEVAAIKAVVEIEAGHSHEGFASPGKPLINFDLTMFRRFATPPRCQSLEIQQITLRCLHLIARLTDKGLPSSRRCYVNKPACGH